MKDTVWLGMMLLFMVDFLLLLGANRLCGLPPAGLRAAASSALGAIHLWLCLLPGFSFLRHWLWRLVFLGLMALVAFGMKPGALYAASVFALLQLAVMGIAAGDGFWTVTLASLVIFLLCMTGRSGPGRQYVPVCITHRGTTVELMALVDTGNTLCDPLSGKQVLVADPAAAVRLLGLRQGELANPIETLLKGKWAGLRLIPYHAIGHSGGMLLGIQPDSITVDGRRADHILAFAPQNVGSEFTFQALVGGMV